MVTVSLEYFGSKLVMTLIGYIDFFTILAKERGNGKWYTIWFILYVLLIDAAFNLQSVFRFGSTETFGEQIVFAILTAVIAFLLSNGLGVFIAIVGLYEHLSDLWQYWFDIDIWLMKHGHGIGTPNFSFDSIIMVDIITICLVLLILLNLLLSAIRCRNMGLKMWMALIPLYNPLILLIKEGKEHSETGIYESKPLSPP